ncbi:MAG: ZIP family metal transporter [Nanoarchaeota archaeon]|nr:ZIP family metal transporter [Nanoarchaeota archaeon]
MVHEVIYIILAVISVSLISLLGVVSLALGKNLKKWLYILVAFAAGSLLGTAFFDLIPESYEVLGTLTWVLVGIIIFFLIEAVIHWHHSHGDNNCEGCLHPVVYLNLIGDGVHNFLDGIIIAASFLVDVGTGIATTFSIALHEIPQEIGDFGVLVYGGMKKFRALMFNFLSASLAILGGIVGYLFLSRLENYIPYVIAIAAGSFIYIATSDLFPELHKEPSLWKKIVQLIAVVLGVVVIGVALGLVGN